MTAQFPRRAEIALPAAAFGGMRTALASAVGPDTAAEALRAAGHAAGDAFFAMLDDGSDPAQMPADRFWDRLSQLFSSRGWGQLRFSEVHPGVGALDSTDWLEAEPASSSQQPTCHFTTGLIANLLGRTAAAEVAVLEVECRSRGDSRCRFLFGGATAVCAVYERLCDGTSADTALEQIR
jgi:predicted hydrocarbon binding protein